MVRFRPALDEVAGVSYKLSEPDYAALDASDSWVTRLLGALELQMGWLSPLLTGRGLEGLLQCVVDKATLRLEALLSRKQFNQLGGLQLDKDTRTLVSKG